ncbi:redoxin family protein [uncultured Devosia sp.]|uniref:redoxin family protein n=1 Tax=uncultured Devosia sp. TaxID=211434 RepID=UPI0026393543|nr:redoxin family protein [uncultured Devosia sp.]
MPQPTPIPGRPLPDFALTLADGGTLPLVAPGWRLLVIFRGAHCPMCEAFLSKAEEQRQSYDEAGIALVLATADPADRAAAFLSRTGYRGRVAAGLTLEQMTQLGLHITQPDGTGASQPFAEPAAFATDDHGRLHLVQIGNAPYARPDLAALLAGLVYDRSNAIPARGGGA